MNRISRTMKRTGLLGLMFVMLPAVLLMWNGHARATDLSVGNIKAVETENASDIVRIIRTGFSGVLSGKPGDAVFAGDTLKTSARVKARIELSDGTVIILGPNSAVQVKGYQVDRNEAKRNIVMKTLKGTVRFTVAGLFKPHPAGNEIHWKDSSVTIETMSCTADVQGTDFIVSVGRAEAEIAVFDGTVGMRGLSPSRGEVMVGANQFSAVTRGGLPSQPAAIPPEKLAALTGATTLNNPLTSLSGSGNKKKKKVYDAKDLCRELGTEVPLGEALDRSVQSGMPIEDAVCAAIGDCGIGPDVVVYTAIVEGYPVNQVVQSCAECGVSLGVVVSSALAAGGEKRLIIIGAQDAGVTNTAIANAFAGAGYPPGPITGGVDTGGGVPVTIPTPETPIGGGGGAPASTQPASPYKP